MSERRFPDVFTPLPEMHAGCRVVAAFRVPPRMGELKDQAVVIAQHPENPANRQFIVWDAAVRGGEWVMFSGFWDASWSEAVTEYTRRVASRA
jgi:hypothetical protein